jgi:hypothetical protein
MKLGVLGDLEIDQAVDEWLVSVPLVVPYFGGTKLKFVLDGIVAGDPNPEEFESAAACFLTLSEKDRRTATQYVEQHRRAFSGSRVRRLIDALAGGTQDIWDRVRATQIEISRREKDQKVYVRVLAECDWDKEHGLQLVFRDGKVLSRVSSQDGHLTYSDAHAVPDSADKIIDL